MANTKISGLPDKFAPHPADFVPIVDTANPAKFATKKTRLTDIIGIFVNVPNGVVGLNASSKIPLDYLPESLSDVAEYDTLSDFPQLGETGKIYIAADTDYIYRWGGSAYIEIGNRDWNAIQNLPQAIQDVAAIPDFAQYVAASSATTEEFSVKAVSQGAYADGNIIPAGTSLEAVIKNMLQTRVPAVYTQPALTISSANSLVYEYGATISITVTLSWAKNDAGLATGFSYKRAGAVVSTISGPAPSSFSQSLVLDSPISFTGEVNYSAGEQEFDNMGDPSGTPIPAGTKATANSVTFTPRHKRYWGLSANAVITDAEILQLESELATSRAQVRNDFTPTNEYIYIAYPVSFGLATIKFNGYIATSSWQRITRSFVNANGYSELYYIYRTEYTQNSPDIDIEVL